MRLVRPSVEILSNLPGLAVAMRAGRCCYRKSESKIGNDTAGPFCEMLVSRGHESVIEHASAMVKFTIDRGVRHELVRHRLCSLSQESTRYCNYKGGVTFIIPPWVDLPEGKVIQGRDDTQCCPVELLSASLESTPRGIWLRSIAQAECDYTELRKLGWRPEQARSVLPNSLKTEIVVTANLREWRHIFRLRTAKVVHPQMREVMLPLLSQFQEALPEVFQDITVPQA